MSRRVHAFSIIDSLHSHFAKRYFIQKQNLHSYSDMIRSVLKDYPREFDEMTTQRLMRSIEIRNLVCHYHDIPSSDLFLLRTLQNELVVKTTKRKVKLSELMGKEYPYR
ncbi:hypothetical protein [Shouchella shacheensis]|uniref:hypothetical protein n=1 Tax=Shouchella shacheensis TaxID=1649580 RepID=UPI00073FB203|nr:hypothetical protein [Shouchella shacheensis]